MLMLIAIPSILVATKSFSSKEEISSEIHICPPPEKEVVYIEVPIIKEEEKTFYDTLTQEEITLIELTVQHEVGLFSQGYRELIAGIIRNRVESPNFPNTVKEVLLAPGQFTNGNYNGVEVDEITKQAVKNALDTKENFHSATFYYNPDFSSQASIFWFEESGDIKYLFSYSENLGKTSYTTRFFR